MTTRLQRLMAAAMLIGASFIAGAAPAGSQPAQIQANDLINGKTIVLGILNKPLGTYMTVEGDYFGPRAMTKCGLYVESIDNLHRGAVIIILVDDRGLTKPIEAGRRYRLRGFETGDFAGVPDDPQNPPTPEEMRQRQKAGPYTLDFSTRFYMTKAEDLGPIAGGNQ